MCQISVVVEREGTREKIVEGVTRLEVTSGGVVLSTFFEEPTTIPDVAVGEIDFLGGTVVLRPKSG